MFFGSLPIRVRTRSASANIDTNIIIQPRVYVKGEFFFKESLRKVVARATMMYRPLVEMM